MRRQGWHGDFPVVHVLANTLVPVVSTAHLVVQRLIGITRQATRWALQEPTPKVRVAQ